MNLNLVVADEIEVEEQQELQGANMAQEDQEDFDRPMDPSQEAYLMEFLPATGPPPPSVDPSSTVQQTLTFLCESFPAISPAFLQARAEEIGSDQAKLGDFIAEICRDQSSLPSMAQYKKERRQQPLLATVELKMMSWTDQLGSPWMSLETPSSWTLGTIDCN